MKLYVYTIIVVIATLIYWVNTLMYINSSEEEYERIMEDDEYLPGYLITAAILTIASTVFIVFSVVSLLLTVF